MTVEFNENQPTNYNYRPNKGGLSNFIIKSGLVKDEKGARLLMQVITVICFAGAIYFLFKAFN